MSHNTPADVRVLLVGCSTYLPALLEWLTARSAYFEIMPYPDALYEVAVRPENEAPVQALLDGLDARRGLQGTRPVEVYFGAAEGSRWWHRIVSIPASTLDHEIEAAALAALEKDLADETRITVSIRGVYHVQPLFEER